MMYDDNVLHLMPQTSQSSVSFNNLYVLMFPTHRKGSGMPLMTRSRASDMYAGAPSPLATLNAANADSPAFHKAQTEQLLPPAEPLTCDEKNASFGL